MQTNDFEKLVSSQMEEFLLQPSSEVWDKVESRIKLEKKRRRAIIFWVLPVVLLLIAGGYYYSFQVSNDKETVVANNVHDANALPNEGTEKIKIEDANNLETNSSESINEKSTSNKSVNPAEFTPVEGTIILQGNITQADPKLYSSRIKEKISSNILKPGIINLNEQEIILPLKKELDDLSTTKHVSHGLNTIEKKEAEKETITDNEIISEKGMPSTENKPLQTVGKENKTTAANKWKFSITASSGISNMLVKNNSMATQFTNNQLSTSVGSSQLKSFQKPYSKALSYGLGIQFQKQLSTKTFISVGVNYQLFKTNTSVGRFVDSSKTIYDSVFQNSITVPSYYLGGSGTRHKEKFNYLQIPINVSYQLNKNADKPMLFYGGLSPALLVASNTLLYNSTGNVFYKSKNHLINWNLSAQTGFLFSLLNNKKYSLQLGPEFQYQFINTLKKEYNSNEKFYLIGVKANLLLKK